VERILISGPSITQKEIDYVTDAVTNAWHANAGMYNARFERAFADYIGRRFAVALPSGTAGIHLGLAAFGVGPGDEVIVPDATWIASASPANHLGAEVVFADIDERTWCLSTQSFEACITSRTKAVVPVDLYGNTPDMDAILEVARNHNVAVLEDAAEAIGSRYKGRLAGSFGEVSVFSFHGSKTLTTGEGGMLLTDDQAIYERVRLLADQGRLPGDKMFYNQEVAFKYKMTSMQAALGLAQTERVEELIAKKRQIFQWYSQRLANINGLQLNYEPPDTFNSYWMVTIVLEPRLGLSKEDLMKVLDEHGVDGRPFFFPLSALPAYSGSRQALVARERNSVAYRLTPYGLNLPSGLTITEEKVDYVCNILKEALRPKAVSN
jgi:perosamine synthetase